MGKMGSCMKKSDGNMLEVAMDSKQYLANLQVPVGRVDAVLDTPVTVNGRECTIRMPGRFIFFLLILNSVVL